MDSKVRKPAEAEKYRLERIAEADKQKIVLEAEAEAEAKALKVNVSILSVLYRGNQNTVELLSFCTSFFKLSFAEDLKILFKIQAKNED